MANLTTLIDRLESAAGPDRELDADIAIALDHIASRDFWSIDYIKAGMVPAVTGSIDAAVALAERVLPGWFYRLGRTSLFPNGWAFVSRLPADHCDIKDEAACANGKAANPAIALVIAIIRARQAKGKP